MKVIAAKVFHRSWKKMEKTKLWIFTILYCCVNFGDKNVYPCDAVAIYPHSMFIHQWYAKQNNNYFSGSVGKVHFRNHDCEHTSITPLCCSNESWPLTFQNVQAIVKPWFNFTSNVNVKRTYFVFLLLFSRKSSILFWRSCARIS